MQPRHRFMSAYEQKVEAPDKDFQYILFAAEPYETIAFKVPNLELDKSEGKFSSTWDEEKKVFSVQMFFKDKGQGHGAGPAAAAKAAPAPQ